MRDRVQLSVIITCFNYASFVSRAIESVLNQTCDCCELIVVDDGSTDGSWTIIQRYQVAKSFRITNGGSVRACRHGLQHSDALFVLFLDADDELAPGSLARIVPCLDPDVAKLQFALTPIDTDNRVIGAPFPRFTNRRDRRALRRQVLKTGVYQSPPTSGNVFRRDLCDLLADIDYESAVDGVTLSAAPFLGDVVSLSASLGFYRLHTRNASQVSSQPTAERLRGEADRFMLRHDHLRTILAARGLAAGLVDGQSSFYYRERRFYAAILEGHRPKLGDVVELQYLITNSDRPLRHKVSTSLLFWLSLALPDRQRRAVLAYRLHPGRRSASGLLRVLFRGSK